jgi:3',5'-nucleoside bisphosphate phosphatase
LSYAPVKNHQSSIKNQKSKMIDLHIHSTASDGSLTPGEIFQHAKQAGLKVISITDHDTIAGSLELLQNYSGNCLKIISGIEISCAPPAEFNDFGSIHLLGYGFSIYDPVLNKIIDTAKASRVRRNPEIIQRLNKLGLKVSMDELYKKYDFSIIGRPHIAQLLKDHGYVTSLHEAFDLYLAYGKAAYVKKYKIPIRDAVQAILNAGGIPVLAHPGLIAFSGDEQLNSFIDTLISFGLMGIEVYYTDHDETTTSFYKNLAEQKKLLITGGSDFHGKFTPGVEMGIGRNNSDIGLPLFNTLNSFLESKKEEFMDPLILQKNLGYVFKDQNYLVHALCHRSYLHENSDNCTSDNERFEFLGDAVLGLCIAEFLMEKSPLNKEGELSKLRSVLVSEHGLAEMARSLDLGRFIRLGKGEMLSRGYDKNSILADTFEAVLAAVFLDRGFKSVRSLIRRLFNDILELNLNAANHPDYKSKLQEYVQEKGSGPPVYSVVNETGPDHDKTFEISLSIFGKTYKGFGKTKKAAEQDAAENALNRLQGTCRD